MSQPIRSSPYDALAAVESISDELRANADYAERTAHLSPASIDALKTSGMLSLWRPSSLGGFGCDPLSYVIAAEAIAAADTAAAWMMGGTSAAWFDLRAAKPEFVDEVVATAEVPVLAETFNKPMHAVSVRGGYRVNGATPFASGCDSADWIGHTAFAGERFLLVYHASGVLEIGNDWDGLGLRGTASNTIVAKDAFVPDHRVIELSAPAKIDKRFDDTLYRMPEGIIPVAVAATSLGALRSALDAAGEIAERKTPFASSSTLKHRPLAQLQFGRALAAYRAARAYLHSTLEQAVVRAERGDGFDLRAKADLFLAYAHTLQGCCDAVRLIAKAVGTTAVYKGNAVERALRDAEVISHHAFGAEGRFATVAQAYWGVDVDFPLLAMD